MNNKLDTLYNLFLSIVIGVTTITLFLCVNNNSPYRYTILWQVGYLFFLILTYKHIKPQHLVAYVLIIITQMTPRYVLYPFVLQLTSKGYSGIMHFNISDNEIKYCIILGTIEILLFTFFVLYYETKCKTINKPDKCDIKGNLSVYVLYILLSLFLYIAFGRRYDVINFFTIKTTEYEELASNTNAMLFKYIFSIALTLFLLISISKYEKFYSRGNKLSFILALITALFYTCFITGESRGIQIAMGLIVMLILFHYFPQQKKVVSLGLISILAIIVVNITIFRTGDSRTIVGYNEKKIDNVFEGYSNNLQIYCGGPITICQPILILGNSEDVTLKNLVFDLSRSIFPFNLYLKNKGYTLSQLYNLDLYDGQSTHGHIITALSYGYIFFGFLGIPIFICLNYFLAIKANEFFYRTDSLEVKFLSGYCMIRFVYALFVNTPTILGSTTQYIGTFGLLYWAAVFFQGNKKREKEVNNVAEA